MSDYNSSLPVRTENDGDIVVKIGDGTTPSQQLAVNSDGSVNITDNGGSLTVDQGTTPWVVSSTDLDIRDLDSAQDSVEVLQASHDNLNANANIQVGNADVANGNPVPVSDAGGSLTVDATDLDIRDLVFASDKVDVSGSTVTAEQGTTPWVVSATDLDIRDITHVSDSIKIGDGTDFLAINADGSINVVPQEDAGTETVNYNTSAALAGGGTSNHDLVFASASKLYQVWASASGKLKITVQIETGAATNTFNTVAVGFNSTANPNINLTLSKYAAIPLGARVRVIRMNNENQAQDVYSTIVGILG